MEDAIPFLRLFCRAHRSDQCAFLTEMLFRHFALALYVSWDILISHTFSFDSRGLSVVATGTLSFESMMIVTFASTGVLLIAIPALST
jgi:hypothetical protein